MVNTVRSLAWELVFIRAQSLAHCSSSWCFRVKSALVCCGIFFYADDLVLIADTLEECISKHMAWKGGMESKGPCVNMKTKFLVSSIGLDVGVVNVSSGSTKCSSFIGQLVADPDYICPRCCGKAGPIRAVGQWLKWMLTAPCLMWRPLFATRMTCSVRMGAVTVQLVPDGAWPMESLAHPQYQAALYQDVPLTTRCTQPAFFWLSSTEAKHNKLNASDLQWLHSNCCMIRWICGAKD